MAAVAAGVGGKEVGKSDVGAAEAVGKLSCLKRYMNGLELSSSTDF